MPLSNNNRAVTKALTDQLPSWVPDWLKPSGGPDIGDAAGLMGPIEAPAAAGIALLKSSPSRELAQRLIQSGGNAIKGTSLEEAIHYLAGRVPRTLSHISEIVPSRLTEPVEGMMGGASLGQFLPHAKPINGQIGNILVDEIVPHMDVPDAVGVLAHETTHAGQYLRAADELKGQNWHATPPTPDSPSVGPYANVTRKNTIPQSQWTPRINKQYLQQVEKNGYFNAPFEQGARLAEQNNILRVAGDELPDGPLPAWSRGAEALRLSRNADGVDEGMMAAIQRALANMANGGGIK